jgi:hypothetical protein
MCESFLTRRWVSGLVAGVGLVVVTATAARAQYNPPACPPVPCPPGYYRPGALPLTPVPGTVPPSTTAPPTTPTEAGAPEAGAPFSFAPESSALALSGGTAAVATGAAPQMIGDFLGYTRQHFVLVPITPANTPNCPCPPGTLPSTVLGVRAVVVTDPIVSRAGSAFKIAENESPIPVDRVFAYFNGFYNAHSFGGISLGGPGVVGSIFADPSLAPQINNLTIVVPGRRVNVYREVVGFEKTFLDGITSVGIRLPVFQQDGTDTGEGIGDMSVVLKGVLFGDPRAGRVISGGMVITAPTGPGIDTLLGDIQSTLLQPWTGFYARGDSFYAHGFSSLVVPTSSKDVTVAFNDLGVGYFARPYDPSRLVSLIAPTFEAHLSTPLNNRDRTEVVRVVDTLVFTGGVHVGLGARSLLTLAAATPVTGPRPFDIEASVLFNLRF